MTVGTEWLVDAHGCHVAALRDLPAMRALCETILHRLELKVVGEPAWHAFGGEGGVTGLYLLTESHLAVHTYPEHALATLNLYCCRPRALHDGPPWREELSEALGAKRVLVRIIERGAS